MSDTSGLDYECPRTRRAALRYERICSAMVYVLGVLMSIPLTDVFNVMQFGRPGDRSWGELSLQGLYWYISIVTPIMAVLIFGTVSLRPPWWVAWIVGLAAVLAQLYWVDLWY